MKKTFTSFVRRLSLLLLFCMVTVGAMAQKPDYKPYPVYFPLADYPEFEYGTKALTFADPRSTATTAKAPSIQWSSNVAGTNVWANCATGSYKKAPLTSPNSAAFPAGRALSWACGYNRALYFNFKTPYLNPGTYRIYMSVAFDNGSTNRVGGKIYRVKLDNELIQMSDSTLTNRTLVNAVQLTGGNKLSVKFTGTGNKCYDAFLGTVTIPADSAKRHDLSFNLTPEGGAGYAISMLQFIPVTATNLDADYEYPKFDCAGNVFFAADSLKTVDNVAVSGYYLPYQFADTTVYTKFDVTLDAGLYFANKMIVVKRADDKWTRLYAGTTDATGKVTTKLPAGSYLVEINKAVYSTTINVSEASTISVGVSTSTVHTSYSPEVWYVGKQFKVYNPGETVLLYDFTIPESGIIPDFALPVDAANAYKYYVKNTDGTTFDAGTILVANTTDITLDLKQAKQDVNINFGNDVYGNNQDFTIVRSTNASALYVSSKTSATGTFTTKLPAGTYYMASKSGLILKTFTVANAALTVDVSARYALNLSPGKTVAGSNVGVYLTSSKQLLNTVTLDASGKAVVSGLPNGRYFYKMYTANGTDTTYILKKFTFVIEGADFVVGDPTNVEQPYYLPYKVYFDIASGQPELTWRTGVGTILPGQLKNIKCENVPIDTIYNVKDTTWIYTQGTTKIDTTFKVNYDSTSVKEIKYFDWGLYYGFGGITVPSTTANTYVWGDQFNFRLAPKKKLTFVTPNLNPGRYNVYMSNRWKPAPGAPDIDTTYMDGKPLLVTDGLVRSFKDYGNGNLLRQFQTTNSAQTAMHLGEALVTKPGTHELSLYSIVGSTGSAGQNSSVWGSMIYFVPVDQDSVGINVTYYPRVDYLGRAVYRNASEGNTTALTTLGTDGVNRPKYFPQFEDPSILANSNVDYSKKLTVNGGIYSKSDILTTVSPVDNWTTKSVTADTLGTAVMSLLPKSEPYAWAMDVEGVHGTAVVDNNKTITIPTSISTVLTSNYAVTPSIDDETIGTYTFNSTVKTEALPFYYPISGVVFYTKNSDIIKAAGDTLYKVKNEALNGIAPTYSTDLPIMPYTLASIYTGNGTRLQPANGTVVGMKNVTTIVGSIYPNPARESMNLKLAENDGVATFAIYNQLGQVVRRGYFTGTEHSASLNGVSQGMYLVKVNVNGKSWNTKLLVD